MHIIYQEPPMHLKCETIKRKCCACWVLQPDNLMIPLFVPYSLSLSLFTLKSLPLLVLSLLLCLVFVHSWLWPSLYSLPSLCALWLWPLAFWSLPWVRVVRSSASLPCVLILAICNCNLVSSLGSKLVISATLISALCSNFILFLSLLYSVVYLCSMF